MKILLVLPAAERYRVTRDAPWPSRRAPLRFSILSLTTVAGLTPPEHEVRICDENVEAVDLDADVDLVGIGFMTALAPRAYELAAAFRARGRRVVAGGYHPTLCTAEVLEHFDAVVVGEAEDPGRRRLDVPALLPPRPRDRAGPPLRPRPRPPGQLARAAPRPHLPVRQPAGGDPGLEPGA